jgi:hypothetical protein
MWQAAAIVFPKGGGPHGGVVPLLSIDTVWRWGVVEEEEEAELYFVFWGGVLFSKKWNLF